MRNLVFILTLLVTSLLHGQNVIKEGYWKAVQGDSVGKNRSEMHKAQADGNGMWKNNKEDIVYLYPPTRFRMEFEDESESNQELVIPLFIEGIMIDNITETSANIHFELHQDVAYDNYEGAIFMIREKGMDQWTVFPTEQLEQRGKLLYTGFELKPNTYYQFQLHVKSSKGYEYESSLTTFKTL